MLTRDVADLGVAMMMCLSRGMVEAQDWVRSGNWGAQGFYPLKRRIHGKRAGILCLGRIGYEVDRRLAAKDFASGWTDVDSAEKLAERCDFLFVTLAASAATRHIVGKSVIEALGPEGMLINISRASNIDEEALLDALEGGRIGSAVLDVFDGEPDINPRFLALENVLLQPHHASRTYETRNAMGKLVFDNLAAHFAGKPLPTPVLWIGEREPMVRGGGVEMRPCRQAVTPRSPAGRAYSRRCRPM